MEQIGEVTAVRDGMVEITFCRPEECEKCHGCAGHRRASVLTVPGVANVGDAAVVAMPDGTLVRASLMAYLLPAAGLMAGLAAGWSIAGSDLAAGLGGVIGLAVAGAVAILTEKQRRKDPAWQPRLTRIIPAMTTTEKGAPDNGN